MYLFKLNYSVLVFSPLGFLCRLLMIYVFQMPDVMTEMGTLGQFTGLVTLLAGNIVFIVFELALTRIFYFYRHFFRPHFLRKVK